VYAAQLYKEGWAPILVCSGSGTCNHNTGAYKDFVGTTEAAVFRDIAVKEGVPEENILVEDKSQNTGQNYEFTTQLLASKGITKLSNVIVVQKQFMERRTYATGKVWWPDVNIIVKSPPMSMINYPSSNPAVAVDDHWIHAMVGDLQRIKEYPKKGFQIPQDMDDDVWEAFRILVDAGYTRSLLK